MSGDPNPEKTSRYPNAGYWLVSILMVALIVFVFVANAQQERVRREGMEAAQASLSIKKELRPIFGGEVSDEKLREVLEFSAKTGLNPKESAKFIVGYEKGRAGISK